MFDITTSTGLEAVRNWHAEFLKTSGIKNIGNKSDMNEMRKVSKEKAQGFADKMGFIFKHQLRI